MADTKLIIRVCRHCLKDKGTTAFRWKEGDNTTRRDYFHPRCFRRFIKRRKGQ